ncbi:Uncharacterized protein QTN25_003572 [Entamoeba marina]
MELNGEQPRNYLVGYSNLFKPENKMRWTVLCTLILRSLKVMKQEQDFFCLKKDIYSFVEDHWDIFSKLEQFSCGTWKKAIVDALNHSTLFESGKDIKKVSGYYRLSDSFERKNIDVEDFITKKLVIYQDSFKSTSSSKRVKRSKESIHSTDEKVDGLQLDRTVDNSMTNVSYRMNNSLQYNKPLNTQSLHFRHPSNEFIHSKGNTLYPTSLNANQIVNILFDLQTNIQQQITKLLQLIQHTPPNKRQPFSSQLQLCYSSLNTVRHGLYRLQSPELNSYQSYSMLFHFQL